jgi:hypothetical protein
MAAAGETGWLRHRRIAVRAVAHLAPPQQDHHPHLLVGQSRRTERSGNGIWFVRLSNDNDGYVDGGETNYVAGGPSCHLDHRCVLCVRDKHNKCEAVIEKSRSMLF